MTTISTAAELEALPVGSVWTDAYDNIGFRQEPGYLVPTGTWLDSLDKRSPTKWQTASEVIAETERYGALPLTVLYRPDRPVQPTVLPSVGEIADCIAAHPCDRDGDGHTRDDCPQARAMLALIGGRTEAEAVKGVQRWMALDLHMALGHGVEPPADAEQDWDDWWARMLAEVREHHTEAEQARARLKSKMVPASEVHHG